MYIRYIVGPTVHVSGEFEYLQNTVLLTLPIMLVKDPWATLTICLCSGFHEAQYDEDVPYQ